MTVMGASALLAAGLVASPGAALATLVSAVSDERQSAAVGFLADSVGPGSVSPVEADVAPSVEDEREELAATGTSSAIGFALIAIALIGGGVTLTVLRRKGVFDG